MMMRRRRRARNTPKKHEFHFACLSSFSKAGIDSLSAVEFRGKISTEFRSVRLPSTLMFDHPTLKAHWDALGVLSRVQVGSPSQISGITIPGIQVPIMLTSVLRVRGCHSSSSLQPGNLKPGLKMHPRALLERPSRSTSQKSWGGLPRLRLRLCRYPPLRRPPRTSKALRR